MQASQTRRRFLGAVAAGVAAPLVHAQARYPERPLTLVMPGTVGGSPDTMARLLALKIQPSFGQPIVVDTVPGASGIIGTTKMLRAPADGYTALYGFNQLVTMNPHLVKDLPYDPEKDLAPVTMTADLGYIWIANNDFPASTVPEWVAYMRANPRKATFGTTGPGSAANLGGELLMKHTGTQMLAVPYKGNSNADLIGGVINLKMEPYTTAVPLVTGGKVKALAVTGTKRLQVLPNVPTLSEHIKDYVIRGWQAVWMKAGTPQPMVERLQREFAAALRQPDVAERMATVGLTPTSTTPQELAELTRQESRMWGDLIRERNIRAE